MDAALKILEDELDRMGMRMVHVVQVGTPLDTAAVELQLVPAQSRWGMYSVCWEEGKRIKRFHARVFWPCREAVDLRDVESGKWKAVMWMLEPGQSARAGMRDAAEAFWGMYDQWPHLVTVNPVDGKRWGVDRGVVVIQGGIAEAMGYAAVRLGAAEWCPKGGLVVARGDGERPSSRPSPLQGEGVLVETEA